MRYQDENAGNKYDLPTYLGPWGPEDQVIGDAMQPMQPFVHHFIKVSPPVLNHAIQQG